MTPREIIFAQRGFEWREEREEWRMASMIAAIYDVNRNPKKRRKPITARDILGKKPETPKARTPEAQKAILDALVERTSGMKRPARASTQPRRHPATSLARR